MIETMGRFTGITYVIPCGADKVDHPAPAKDLYTGSMFRHTYENVARLVADDLAAGRGGGQVRILILSAKYGLVEVDRELEPYELKMGAAGSVTAEQLREQATALGMGWGDGDDDVPGEVYALLPRPYLAVLDEALRGLYVYAQDVYEGCGGIGEQRRVNAIIGRPDAVSPAEPDGEGLHMWLGGDVPALWWGLPVLVSYGRLVRAKSTLPVAQAPWVCDSRGFNEIMEHGEWTIPVEQYARDLDRYADEIGRLAWAAPQDWPAAAPALERTGLSEHEHQARTIAGYEQLVPLTKVEIIYIVTGKDLAGYLRHLDMWKAAGHDLTRTDKVVGVGALVGRPAAEAAQIIRALHAAGVRRMHGLGVKGPVLALVGPLLESVDSADWSGEARREAQAAGEPGLCPHGLVRYERNCRVYAQTWAHRQLALADRAMVQEMLPIG